MKLAYTFDTMLQVEVVGGAPSGAVVAVEPAQAQEARTSILESQRWLEIRAGYGRDLSGFIVRLQTNVEEIPPSKVVFWMKAAIPDEPEPVNVTLGHAGENPDVTWWIASLDQQDRTQIIEMFQLDALRAWEESKSNSLLGVTIYHLAAQAVVGPMVVTALAGLGHQRGELGVSVRLVDKPSPFLSAALVADSRLGWRMRANTFHASAEVQAAVMLSREGEDPNIPVLSVAVGW